MRTFRIFIGLLVVLVIGGAVTLLLSDGGSLLPFIQQTSNPGASTSEIEGWQAEQFFLLVGFLVTNMVGIGLTIAALMWFLNRGVKQVEAEAAIANSNDAGAETA